MAWMIHVWLSLIAALVLTPLPGQTQPPLEVRDRVRLSGTSHGIDGELQLLEDSRREDRPGAAERAAADREERRHGHRLGGAGAAAG
jgi:hypothetical protein